MWTEGARRQDQFIVVVVVGLFVILANSKKNTKYPQTFSFLGLSIFHIVSDGLICSGVIPSLSLIFLFIVIVNQVDACQQSVILQGTCCCSALLQ